LLTHVFNCTLALHLVLVVLTVRGKLHSSMSWFHHNDALTR